MTERAIQASPQTTLPGTSLQRVAAVGLLFSQTFILGFLMEAYVFATCASIIACLSLFARRDQLSISLKTNRWIFIVGAVFFLKYSVAPREFDFHYSFIFTELAYEIASFCIVVELIMMFRRENLDKLPVSFLAFAAVGLVFTGNVRLNDTRRLVTLIVVQTFLIAWAWFAVGCRRQIPQAKEPSTLYRNLIMGGVLLFATIAGVTTSVLLHRNERELENLVTGYISLNHTGPAQSGFSGRGGLSDVSGWKERDSQEIALRIISKNSPGYLRGKVFNELTMNRWTATLENTRNLPAAKADKSRLPRPSDNLFRLRTPPTASESDSSDIVDIWPVDHETAGHCLTPLNSTAIACRSKTVTMDPNFIVIRPEQRSVVPYSVIVAPQRFRQPEITEAPYLQLPPTLDPRILQTAKEVFREESTTTPKGKQPLPDMTAAKKMETVQQFFHQNFEYQLGASIPYGEDPLAYFLANRTPAHCEYFATATTVLLRLQGVPARYVTGYVAQEKNRFDETWIARRKDAHAWVEAYDDQKQSWVIVESTPSNGVPQSTSPDEWQQRREAMAHSWRQIRDLVERGDYFQLLWIVVQPLLWFTLSVAVIIGALVGLKQWWTQREAPEQIDPASSHLVRERRKMDHAMQRAGFRRERHETPRKFADRIEANLKIPLAKSIAQWYRDYSVRRFRPGNIEVAAIELRERRKQMTLTKIIFKRAASITHSDTDPPP